MATVVSTRVSVPDRPLTPPPQLSLNTSQHGSPAAVPNKYIPFCSPGPRPPSSQLDSPPVSPPSPGNLIETSSVTHPPDDFEKVIDEPPVYSIPAAKLEEAIDHLATQSLPAARQVFPWLHGLHAENQLQLAFFIARKKSLRRTPKCIRGMTIVKAGGDLQHSKIKGAIAPEEILRPLTKGCDDCDFLEIDPKDGFSVRNFQIQACKMATVSDIVVYGDQQTPKAEVEALARRISRAQGAWQRKTDGQQLDRLFNTFILSGKQQNSSSECTSRRTDQFSDDYEFVETDHSDLVALDAEGCMTGKVIDFFHWERTEMYSMSAPTEICKNVWLGPTPDPNLTFDPDGKCLFQDAGFDIHIEASDLAQIPDSKTFKALERFLDRKDKGELSENELPMLEFPGSGAILPPTWSQVEVDCLMQTCEWIHKQANPQVEAKKRRDSKFSASPDRDSDGDSIMHGTSSEKSRGRKVLIHCTDGYTESSLLALAYYMYSEGVPAHDAWLQLHREKRRNFFAYGSDVAVLQAIQPRILQASPKHSGDVKQLCPPVPDWLEKMDGSLPSRVLSYMYLGNLCHANNPLLLKELGIGQILSIGEPVSWTRDAIDSWPQENLLFVDRVQDNGVDPLMEDFGRCLEFIGKSRLNRPSPIGANLFCREWGAKRARQHWCIAASAFPDQQLFALLKS